MKIFILKENIMENKVKKYNFLKISIYTFLFLILF